MRLEDEIKQIKFASEYKKAMLNILFTASWVDVVSSKMLKSHGISLQQYNVLRILKGQHPNSISVNDIMSRMLDRMSNASRLVEKLRLKDLVERTICEKDRRQVDVKITDKGIKLLDELNSKMDNIGELESKITEEEAFLVNEILDKIRG